MSVLEHSVAADRAALPDLLDWLTRAADQFGLDAECRQRIAIILEELFLNTVDHGFGGQGGAPIRYRLEVADGERLRLCQEDRAAAFDLARADTPTASLERVGGLGITMIHGMSKGIAYRREDGRNITTIEL